MTIIAFNRYWVVRWPWVCVNFLAVLLLLGLSLWQWQRAEEKYQTLERIAGWKKQGAVNVSRLLTISAADRDGVYMEFSGRWLAPAVWLLDNRLVNGRAGYDVLIAVKDISSSGNTPAVLLNLGWIAAPVSRASLPAIDVPSVLPVQGIFRTRTQGILLGTNIENNDHWPIRIQQVDPSLLSNSIDTSLVSGVVYQEKNSPFVIHYRPVMLPPERHKAYALQWFLLAIAVVVIALAASGRKKIQEPQA
ncbi:SURF1 family protein [Cellvibrio sp. UBA7661]|uniref:SURF1 family protein n=1 Tax=Cellvibrio sp. UBA7661 TaxID=1946311 RepID=UPI002F35D195